MSAPPPSSIQGVAGEDEHSEDEVDWVPKGPPMARQLYRAPPPPIRPAPAPATHSSIIPRSVQPAITTVPDDPVTAVARLQSFDGSFDLDEPLRKLIFGDKLALESLKGAVPSSIRAHPEAEKIWATAIAVAYLKTNASDSMDVWVGLWEKANDYAARVLMGNTPSFDQVVSDAVEVL